HYGRWTYNSYYGWVWIPGHEWAPAWVSWRSGGGVYGWAPMGPGYVAGSVYDYPDNYWVFVSPDYLYESNVYGYYQPRHVRRYIRETNYINETYVDNGYHSTYYYGPRREVIERESHRPVQVYKVSGASAPRQTNVSGNVVQVYRPSVNAETRTTARPVNPIRASQPVGRPQAFTRGEGRREPEFRQQMQSGGVNGAPQQGSQQMGRQQPQRFQQEPSNNTSAQQSRYQLQNNRPQEQRYQPQPQSAPQPVNRPQPQSNQPTMRQQGGSQPKPTMQQSGGNKPTMRESEKRK
ncbi:MAG: hypothetical protein JWQ38_1151, partial [Flavipsychrobacter sp.]|nr:hypothetical protein [Flavipsychrobacter sp.]